MQPRVCVCGILLIHGLALKQGRQAAQCHYCLIPVFFPAAMGSLQSLESVLMKGLESC